MFERDLAIDLGTTNTVILEKGKGIILNEPSVVAINANTKEIFAIGLDAKGMLPAVPGNVNPLQPIKDGVITDFDHTREMLKHFMIKAKVAAKFAKRPRVLVAVPMVISRAEKQAVSQVLRAIGIKKKDIFLIDKIKAAAICENLPIDKPQGSMIVDIGGGTTDSIVMSMNEIVAGNSTNIAGDKLDESIAAYIKKQYNTAITVHTAETIKNTIGCAYENDSKKTCEIKGVDLTTNSSNSLTIKPNEIAAVLKEPIQGIITSIKQVLEKTPPELSSDIMQAGITLTGGGSLLKGINRLISEETGVAINSAENVLQSVTDGMHIVFNNFENMQHLLTSLE
ncbi:MAG: rod shape-determining protein MreB [Firmicutes bacterium]|nr:rod shape-determining protein MreB [Bacillota bacterium]